MTLGTSPEIHRRRMWEVPCLCRSILFGRMFFLNESETIFCITQYNTQTQINQYCSQTLYRVSKNLGKKDFVSHGRKFLCLSSHFAVITHGERHLHSLSAMTRTDVQISLKVLFSCSDTFITGAIHLVPIPQKLFYTKIFLRLCRSQYRLLLHNRILALST